MVTRGLGKPCIVGCEGMQVDLELREMSGNGLTLREGDRVSMDGALGQVYTGELATVNPRLEDLPEAKELLGWADEARRLGVMANADTPADARQAIVMGAEGIGLCRTEHMFLDPEPAARRAADAAELGGSGGVAAASTRTVARRPAGQPFYEPGSVGHTGRRLLSFYQALDRVKLLQTNDFRGILRVMSRKPGDHPAAGRAAARVPAALRRTAGRVGDAARHGGVRTRKWRRRKPSCSGWTRCGRAIRCWGTAGAGLGLSFPDIYRMQVEAIITAGAQLVSEGTGSSTRRS